MILPAQRVAAMSGTGEKADEDDGRAAGAACHWRFRETDRNLWWPLFSHNQGLPMPRADQRDRQYKKNDRQPTQIAWLAWYSPKTHHEAEWIFGIQHLPRPFGNREAFSERPPMPISISLSPQVPEPLSPGNACDYRMPAWLLLTTSSAFSPQGGLQYGSRLW